MVSPNFKWHNINKITHSKKLSLKVTIFFRDGTPKLMKSLLHLFGKYSMNQNSKNKHPKC